MLNFRTLLQVIQKPIELGADFVIQSTTKFYDGHNMTVGGAVVAATDDLHELIKHMQNVHGNIMSPQAQMRSPAHLPCISRVSPAEIASAIPCISSVCLFFFLFNF